MNLLRIGSSLAFLGLHQIVQSTYKLPLFLFFASFSESLTLENLLAVAGKPKLNTARA